jgi:hypothetical protein
MAAETGASKSRGFLGWTVRAVWVPPLLADDSSPLRMSFKAPTPTLHSYLRSPTVMTATPARGEREPLRELNTLT